MENERRIFISPNYTIDDFKKFEIDEKIKVFEDRVTGWILDVCKNIYDFEIPHNEFAILKLICSCFEMIGKFCLGYIGDKDSKKHFIRGFKAIYHPCEQRAADLFYTYIRNSIYHTGFISPNVLITQEIDKAFGYNENDLIKLNVRILYRNVRDGFAQLVSDLQNEENSKLRDNFEARFDYESRHFFTTKLGDLTNEITSE